MSIKVSAPGRVCLFGEHQDYLGLPVIPMAIDLRVGLEATPRDDELFVVELPDINSREVIVLNNLEYTRKRDYFKSILRVLIRNGYSWEQGWHCTVRGDIPINSGTSSSSALNNVWCRFLVEVSSEGDKNITNQQIGRLSYEAEVLEFNEAGGMMDQYSTAIGGMLFMDFTDPVTIRELDIKPGWFVLGDSLEPKNTEKILSETKMPALTAMQKIKSIDSLQSFKGITYKDLQTYSSLLTALEKRIMEGVIRNRDITLKALFELQQPEPDNRLIGKLLTEHHFFLDKNLGISTPKINRMIDAALKAGAFGGKINGSGGGGCMFAYAPDNPEEVADAIRSEGAEAYVIQISKGLVVNDGTLRK
jgi:galactokinase